MESDAYSWPVTAIERRAGKHPDGLAIADAFCQIWQEIEAALFGLIGHRGVAGLYQRSLFLAGTDYSWLNDIYTGIQSPADLDAFRAALLRQTISNAINGSSAFLQIFNQMLANLIGPKLTWHLLSPVWKHSSSGSAAQDTVK